MEQVRESTERPRPGIEPATFGFGAERYIHSATSAREEVRTFLRTCSVIRFVTLVFDHTLPAEAGRIAIRFVTRFVTDL